MPTKSMNWRAVQEDINEKLKQKPADDVKKKIVIPDPVPAGNHLAHFIRSIHWNSKGMLPSTAGSQRTYDKYGTVTSLSFQGPDGFEIRPGEAAGGFNRKKETIEDIMLDPRKNQMFNRWKVPDRIIDSAPVGMKSGGLEDIPEVRPTVARSPSAASQRPLGTPRAPSVHMGSPKPASRMSREMSLDYYDDDVPNIKLKPHERTESRNGLQKSVPSLPKSAEMKTKPQIKLQRSQTMMLPSRKVSESDVPGASLQSALRPEAVPQAEAWMKHADKADRKVIERILKMASSKHKLENSLRHTLLPDAKDSVEKWLKDANENERHVALDFFNSLAGGQLMGMTVDGKRKRLKEVINTLENAPAGNKYKMGGVRHRKETISDGKLKYIRLLTPDTRENRWMFSTWHHLPEYRDDNVVGNWSSHYIRPHAGIPRHFTIHPDWGP